MDGCLPSWSAFGTMVEEDAQTDLKVAPRCRIDQDQDQDLDGLLGKASVGEKWMGLAALRFLSKSEPEQGEPSK